MPERTTNMTYTERLLISIGDTTDFTTMLKLMLKLEGMVITTQDTDYNQCIYVIGARDTVVYKFYKHKLFDRAVKPYGTKPTMYVDDVTHLIAYLCAQPHLTITIHTQ